MTQSAVSDYSAIPSSTADPSECSEVIHDEAAVPTDNREKFIPLTRAALLDRLLRKENWREDEFAHVECALNYLGLWRHNEYRNRLATLVENYLPFSPDRDTIRVMEYSDSDKKALQAQFVKDVESLLIQGNYQRVSEKALNEYFTAKSPYGLNLKVDLEEYEEVFVFCRGSEVALKKYRSWKKLYLGTECHEVPIFKRLFLTFKMKPEDVRVKEIMEAQEVTEKKARKILKGHRKNIPEDVTSDFIYLKLFKNIPQSDLEMLFPNTKVDFRLVDKIKLGVTAGGGTVAGIAGVAGKLVAAFATFNIFALIGGFVGLVGLIGRQVMKFFNQRTQYMMVLAQNLYFHALADNRGVLTLMCDRAEEEDFKEEALLYAYLCQFEVPRVSLHDADLAIEAYLKKEFNIDIDFDFEDALSRLEKDGLVNDRDGLLCALRPPEAVAHLEKLWHSCLDQEQTS